MKMISLKLRLSSAFLIFLLCDFWFECPAAEPNVVAAVTKTQKKSSGGYCGIYCLYASMKYFRVNIDPNELIKPEYIGSVHGSSLAELKKAAEKFGLYAFAVDRTYNKRPSPTELAPDYSHKGVSNRKKV